MWQLLNCSGYFYICYFNLDSPQVNRIQPKLFSCDDWVTSADPEIKMKKVGASN